VHLGAITQILATLENFKCVAIIYRYVKFPHSQPRDCFLNYKMLSSNINSQLHKIDSQSILFTRKLRYNLPTPKPACRQAGKKNF
jgi:hypothetical protein